ncbi:MAG TPA: hypothetical protein VGN27_14655, partial [Gaiellaceae bacterium]|nr:hypothetical protein [Gaiellaceae bacterium]
LLAVATAALAVVPAAIASPTVRLTIMHVLRGCHAWGTADSQPLGPTRTLAVVHGTKLTIRVSCPMGFDMVQTAGPPLALASPWQTGTTHTLVFAKKGVYIFRGTNLVSSVDAGLQTLGPDNVLVLNVRVR